MPETTRTFIALPIPSALGEKLSRLQNLLSPQVPDVRWTATLPFHITLAFLGDVHNPDLNAVCKSVAQAVSPVPALEMRLEGVGAFPTPSRPRVIWAGLTASDPTALAELQKSIVRAAASAGYRPDDGRFTPHATLGRVRSDRRHQGAADLTGVLESLRTWSGGKFTAREVVIFASTLTPDGPVYAALARAPLSGKNTDESA